MLTKNTSESRIMQNLLAKLKNYLKNNSLRKLLIKKQFNYYA